MQDWGGFKMYFPILRGKQNELLALRELLDQDKLSAKILPVIEPIKRTSTFDSLIKDFEDHEFKLAVIQNSSLTASGFFSDLNFGGNNFIIKAFFPDKKTKLFNNQASIGILNEKNAELASDCLKKLKYVIINIQNSGMIYEAKETENLKVIELNDHFDKKNRNADYLADEDTLFSVDHLHYQSDQFSGFSDYSVIGADYSDKGFAAKTVAIHLVYFDKDYKLRIHHFISDSNDDIFNPAKKFGEALEKLIKWHRSSEFNKEKNDSEALHQFEQFYQLGTYPGLGIVKKLSIEHHLEIMGRFLNGGNDE